MAFCEKCQLYGRMYLMCTMYIVQYYWTTYNVYIWSFYFINDVVQFIFLHWNLFGLDLENYIYFWKIYLVFFEIKVLATFLILRIWSSLSWGACIFLWLWLLFFYSGSDSWDILKRLLFQLLLRLQLFKFSKILFPKLKLIM